MPKNKNQQQECSHCIHSRIKNHFSLAVKHIMLGYKVSATMKSVSFDKHFSRGDGRDIVSTSGIKSK